MICWSEIPISEPMAKPFKFDPQWARAKQLCRLNLEDIRRAKELGMSPKSLIKNNPGPSQRWKLPVKLWIRELHAKRFGRDSASKAEGAATASPATAETEFEERIPF